MQAVLHICIIKKWRTIMSVGHTFFVECFDITDTTSAVATNPTKGGLTCIFSYRPNIEYHSKALNLLNENKIAFEKLLIRRAKKILL